MQSPRRHQEIEKYNQQKEDSIWPGKPEKSKYANCVATAILWYEKTIHFSN